MNRAIFLTATNTNVGKTYTSIKLIEEFGKRDIKVGVIKPIETGVRTTPLDAKALLDSCKRYNPNFKTLSPEDICTYTFKLPSAPFCADRDNIIDIKKVIEHIKEFQKICDILIVEGAGGLMVPIKRDYFMVDLAKDLNGYTLLVTPSRLGCINETLCSLKILDDYNLDYDWCVNIYQDSDSFDLVTKPFYDEAFKSWWSLESGLKDFVDRILFI